VEEEEEKEKELKLRNEQKNEQQRKTMPLPSLRIGISGPPGAGRMRVWSRFVLERQLTVGISVFQPSRQIQLH